MEQKRKKTSSNSKKSKPAKKAEKNTLTKKDIEYFRQLLLEKRVEIVGNVSEMEDEALQKSRLDAAGDLSSMPIHMADIGTDNYQQELALELMDGERKLLREIDEALNRIEEGSYGICQGTGKPIAKARIEANPWAKYCVKYANELERNQ